MKIEVTDELSRKVADEYFRLCKESGDKPMAHGIWQAHMKAALTNALAAMPERNGDAVARIEANFGHGQVAITTGTHGGVPCVYLAPANVSGRKPGDLVDNASEGLARDAMRDDESVLTFPTKEQAELVKLALCGKLTTPPAPVRDKFTPVAQVIVRGEKSSIVWAIEDEEDYPNGTYLYALDTTSPDAAVAMGGALTEIVGEIDRRADKEGAEEGYDFTVTIDADLYARFCKERGV